VTLTKVLLVSVPTKGSSKLVRTIHVRCMTEHSCIFKKYVVWCKYNNCVIEFQAPDGACPLSVARCPWPGADPPVLAGPAAPPPGLLHSLSPRYETLSFVKTGLTRRAAINTDNCFGTEQSHRLLGNNSNYAFSSTSDCF
jgi:hypothetical protein